MVELKVTIQVRTPLLLGSQSTGAAVQETLHYLPGSVLRGASGARLIQACGHQEHPAPEPCEFARLFLADPPPCFGPCYPAMEGESFPLPATARTCKHHRGFSSEDDEEAHGIRDILIQGWVYEELLKYGPLPFPFPPSCGFQGRCPDKLDRVHGFYQPRGEHYWQPKPRIQRLSRTAIDRRRGVAAEELLYTLELLSERMRSGRRGSDGKPISAPTELHGKVWVQRGDHSLLAERLCEITHLGGGSARGLGEVLVQVRVPTEQEIEVTKAPLPDNEVAGLTAALRGEKDWEAAVPSQAPEGLVGRITRFNIALRQAWAKWARPPLEAPGLNDDLFFSLDLLSETIWPQGGLPTALLPQQLAGAERVRAHASARPRSGWDSAKGWMRPPELAITEGSVFLYRLRGTGDEKRLRAALEALQTMERDGIGRGRERGFGRLLVCSPFHLEVEPT